MGNSTRVEFPRYILRRLYCFCTCNENTNAFCMVFSEGIWGIDSQQLQLRTCIAKHQQQQSNNNYIEFITSHQSTNMAAPRPQIHPMYQSYLVSYMSYRDQMTYNTDHVLTAVELTAITPTDIKRWMKYRSYGDPEPGPDARPTHLLLVTKKSISFLSQILGSWSIQR
jgi:hypothetical protein